MNLKEMTRAAALAALTMTMALTASAAEGQGEWIELFDGQTLDNWRKVGGNGEYKVEDGTITGRQTAKGGPNTFLCPEGEFADFELEFEVKLDQTCNSGVQIRSKELPPPEEKKKHWHCFAGPQVEIEPSPGQSGRIFGEGTRHRWLNVKEKEKEPEASEAFKNEDWNHYRVLAEGPRIQVWINGEKVEDVTHEAIYKDHPKGILELQVHTGGPRKETQVRWRNIRIRERKPDAQ